MSDLTSALNPEPSTMQASRLAGRREQELVLMVALDAGLWREPPCKVCGYNGPGYFHPETHPCAAYRASFGDQP